MDEPVTFTHVDLYEEKNEEDILYEDDINYEEDVDVCRYGGGGGEFYPDDEPSDEEKEGENAGDGEEEDAEGEVEVEEEEAEMEEEMFENERNAYERSGYVRNAYAETEQELFLNNMEIYARTHKQDFNRNEHPFAILLSTYPHPRCLNPEACFHVLHFKNASGAYVWNKSVYDKKIKNPDKPEYDITSILYRYVDLFNQFNR